MLFHFSQRSEQSLPTLDLKINDTPLSRVNNFNFLGIIIDQHINWREHIDKISAKISRSIGVIRRLMKFVPSDTLKILYNSMVLPHLQYGILLWGKTPGKLQKIQKKAIRTICKAPFLGHTDPLFKSMKLLN